MPDRKGLEAIAGRLALLRRLLARALLCLLAFTCVQARAQAPEQSTQRSRDAVTERAWLDDPDSSLSAQAALAGPWEPFSGPLSGGFTESTTWVRVKIDPALAGPASIASDRRLVLTIAPSQLDEVAVYRADQLWRPPVLVGDTHPLAGPQQSLLYHAIVLDEVVEPLELLLRLRNHGNHSMHVQALRWDEASAQSARHQSLMAGYLVFTAIAMVWAGLIWLQQGTAVAGLFMVHQLSALVVAITLLGVLRLHGPAALQPLLSDLTSVSIAGSTVVTILFHRAVLSDLGASRRERQLLTAASCVPVLALGVMALGEMRTGLEITHGSIATALILCSVIACRLRPPPDAGSTRAFTRRVYVAAVYALMSALMIPQFLRVMGLLSAGPWSFLGFQAYSVTSAILLGTLLLVRDREERLRRRRAALIFAQTQREAEAQRARVAEQAELMTMLTHELKTPLSVVSLALGRAGEQATMQERALRAVGNMRDVIDRCAQAARLDDDVERHDEVPPLQPVALQEVLLEARAAQLQAARVDLQVSQDPPPCLGDRQMLTVIATNLLENALKYSPLGSRVRAVIEPASLAGRPGVALRVANPVGTAGRPDAARLFEKYHRGERARHRSGSGLGLYLSRRLAYRMGGELSFREDLAEQVCFELWMPRATDTLAP